MFKAVNGLFSEISRYWIKKKHKSEKVSCAIDFPGLG